MYPDEVAVDSVYMDKKGEVATYLYTCIRFMLFNVLRFVQVSTRTMSDTSLIRCQIAGVGKHWYESMYR